jgi:dTDP-4-amino-4,6-dideoxygalactose transaminase
LIEAAITKKTKAIVPVHYAGVSCEMDTIMEIAKKYKLFVIEDAAQGVSASYKGKPLGSIGHLGCYSFHETKNIISGEGGALLINDPSLVERAEFIRQKGTNRSKFFQGKVDKYTWVDIGSSYLPSEITAAFLWAQMQKADYINSLRVSIWDRYHSSLARFDKLGLLCRPTVPDYVQHNAHMYYLLLPDLLNRARFIAEMNKYNINCVFHYIPLHSSPAGMLYGRTNERLKITDIQSFRLVRLPLYLDLCKTQQDHILITIEKLLL